MTTFTAVLAAQLAADPGRPLVTFYDDASGERVELSRTTYANWVAKLAGLLVDELDLERGMTLRLDLPTHWLGPVALGAAWSVGLVVSDTETPDVVLCGPDTVAAWARRGADGDGPGPVVLAAALLPLGVRFVEPVPAGVVDLGVEIWSQPDAFTSLDPPTDDDAAVEVDGAVTTQALLWSAAADGELVAAGGRLLTVANPASPPGLATWVQPLARGGSLVLVAHADPDRLDATADAERVTDRFPRR